MVRFDINLVFTNFGKMKEMQMRLESTLKTTEKTTKAYKAQEEQLKQINEQVKKMKNQRDAFKDIAGGILPDGVMKSYDKFSRLNEQFAVIADGEKNPMKKFQAVTKDFFADFGSQAKTFASNVQMIFGKGLVGAFKLAGAGIKGLMIGFSGLIPIIASVAAPILAVVAVIYTLKRIWDQNLGGIQTSIFQIGGAFKDFIAKSAVAFDKMLRGLSPVIRILGNVIKMILIPPIKILEGLFLGLMEILTPIAEAIGDAFSPLAELFGMTGEGQGFMDVMNGISAAIQGIGKAVGFVLKIVFTPLKMISEFLTGLIKTVGKLLGLKKDEEKKSNDRAIDRKAASKTYSQTTNTTSNQTHDNRQFTIMGAGPITQNTAGLIMNMIKKDFAVGAKR
jgi:hypothetical protein